MGRRAYGVNRRSNKKKNAVKRVIRARGIGRKIPLTLENVALLVLPLILMLVFIPPKADVAGGETPATETVYSENSIIVYNVADSVIDEFNLEEYITGVVAAEMPASFHAEALKAQAIAARTFAISRARGLYGITGEHFGANICTDPGHCQSYISEERYINNRGSEEAWEKISNAVLETKGIVMTYAGQIINPLYHSNSGGITENIESVWSNIGEVPYLKSVYSDDESMYAGFEKTTVYLWDEVKKRIANRYPEADIGNNPSENIEVILYSTSGRVEQIKIGNTIMSGAEFREMLGLPSTNLEFNYINDNEVEILSKGYGHGVGMSQCGADSLAKKGSNYKEILGFYYLGIKIEELRY